MATTSQIPAVLTGLYNAAFSALSATTTVVDGPPLQWDPIVVPAGMASESRFLFVGARPEDEIAVLQALQTRNTQGTARTEDIIAACTALAKADESSLASARTAAFGIVAALEQALRVDQTLNGACATATLSVDRYEQIQQEDGAYAVVPCTITARAFLR